MYLFDYYISSKEVFYLLYDMLVFVWIDCAGRVHNRPTWFGGFDRADEQLKLRPSDLIDLFDLPVLESKIRLKSSAFS